METVNLSQAIRPSKFAYLVSLDDRESLLRSTSLSVAVWGGVLNPIVPIDPPKLARETILEFDPDVAINLTGRPLPDEIAKLVQQGVGTIHLEPLRAKLAGVAIIIGLFQMNDGR